MATGPDVMKNFFKVLKEYSYEENITAGQSALDKATRAVSAVGSFRQEIIGLKMALLTDKIPEFAGLDSDTRLQKLTGMVLGADGDLTVDTGSISGSNAGGSVVKDAQSIVPEDGDLSTAILPAEGSTTQITYTGDDGKSFTFNVKWPDSFNKFVSGTAIDSTTDINDRLKDSRFLVDFNDFDENEYFYNDDPIMMIQSTATYGDMKNAAPVILKGLNTYWLKESAKLIYDSYGLDFDAKTIEIQLVAGGEFNKSAGITKARNADAQPADNIIVGINLANYGQIDSTDSNGRITNINATMLGGSTLYLDRVVVHEMVHAAMMASGTLKPIEMPVFFLRALQI